MNSSFTMFPEPDLIWEGKLGEICVLYNTAYKYMMLLDVDDLYKEGHELNSGLEYFKREGIFIEGVFFVSCIEGDVYVYLKRGIGESGVAGAGWYRYFQNYC